jgi:hypothetical protein
MSFRLKEAVYKVRCRKPGCPFNVEFTVKENIMGATEADVDSEAMKIAKNLGYIKHDAVYGRNHQIENPEVSKISATYDHIGVAPAAAPRPAAFPSTPSPVASTRTFARGDIIIKRGDSAATVCEVVRGFALNEKLPELHYAVGSTFGAAAIFRQKSRMVDIVAGENGTTIAYYNIKELAQSNPTKARELYAEAMEDVFHILGYLETHTAELEKKLARLTAVRRTPIKKTVKKQVRKPAPKKKSAAKSRPIPKKKTARKALSRR